MIICSYYFYCAVCFNCWFLSPKHFEPIVFTNCHTINNCFSHSIIKKMVGICFRIHAIAGMNAQMKSSLWSLNASVVATWRDVKAAVLYELVDIPERPVEVQQNLRARGGSPFYQSHSHAHTHKQDVFHIPGLLVSLIRLLERGGKCWQEVWTVDGEFGWALPCSSWRRWRVVVSA